MSAQEARQVARAKFDAIIAEVRRLASENPDHVYQAPEKETLDAEFYGVETLYELNSCLYVHKFAGSDEVIPGCIFGQAFLNLGYDENAVASCDMDTDASRAITILIGGDLDTKAPSVQRELNWSNSVQAAQDGGATWGTAVEHADNYWGPQA